MHDPVDCGQHRAAVSGLAYQGQPGVAESNVINTEIYGSFISLPDTGGPEQGIWELHFTARPVLIMALYLSSLG